MQLLADLNITQSMSVQVLTYLLKLKVLKLIDRFITLVIRH